MINTATINFRVKKHTRGWVAEFYIPSRTIFRRGKWKHYISVSGIESEPWYYSSREFAEEELLKKVKWNMLGNSELKPIMTDRLVKFIKN